MVTTFESAFRDEVLELQPGELDFTGVTGNGIEVDEDLARAHPYTGTGLHLEMQEAPCDYVNGNAFEGGAPAPRD